MITMYPFAMNSFNDSGYVQAATSDAYRKAKPITYKNTGSQAKDLVGVAKTQKGQGEYSRYWSSKKGRDIVRTAYGDYFNYDYEWCAAFISWCARKANISKDIIPKAFTASPKFFYGTYYSRGKIVPKTGDIIFYGNSSHVGIVEKSENGYVYTIEGNTSVDSGGSGYVDTHKYKLTNTYIMGYVRPNYANACTHKIDSKTGKCTKCGEAYIDLDGSKLSKGSNTSYKAKRFYRIAGSTPVYKYPSTGANRYSTFPAGRHVQVLGTLDDGRWYKVKYNTVTGYVPSSKIEKYAPSSKDSTIAINNTRDEYSLKHKVKVQFSATVNSNYPIREVKVKIGSKEYKKTFESLYLSNITLQKMTEFDISGFNAGTHDYTFTAKDISGRSVTKSGKIVIYDDGVGVPTVKESRKENGKDVVIETGYKDATIYYSKNGGRNIKVSGKKATVALNEGKTTIKAFIYVGAKRSANVKKTFTLTKTEAPEIEVEQRGKTGIVTIKSKGKVKYSIDGGKTYEEYVKPFEVGGGTTIKAYAAQRGELKSSTVSYTTEYTEPKKPVVKITGGDPNVAEGKTVTLYWEADSLAESYEAVLRDATNDEEVGAVTTEKATATFTVPEAGDYYVTVVATNKIGSSEESEAVEIKGKAPLTVRFIDQGRSGEDEKILSEQKVRYGECCEAVASPSRKGHAFAGWKDLESDTVSTNGYVKKTITEDVTFEAQYEANIYEVALYDTTGKLLQTQKVRHGEAVDTEGLDVTLETGYVFAGWQITSTSEGDSAQDMSKVDSDMEIHAVSVWNDPELPVIATVTSAKVSSDGRYVNAEVKLATEKEKDLSFYLVTALKAKDAKDPGLERTIYVDRKIAYLDAGRSDEPSETTVKIKMPMGSDEGTAGGGQTFEPSSVEAAVVECKKDMSTGSALAETATCDVVRNAGVPYYGDYQTSEAKPEEKEGREILKVPTYTYREKERVKSGYGSLAGYTKESTSTVSTTYGKWQSYEPSVSSTEGATYKTTVTKETSSAHKWYAYYCDCNKYAWKSKSETCPYCGSKTDNSVIVYTKVSYSPNASADNDGSYKFAKTITSGDANRYCIYYNGKYAKSFSSESTKVSVTFFWKAGEFKKNVYRTKTVKTQNTFWKWGGWKTSATPVTATSDRQLGETTYTYKYRDLITPEEAAGRENSLDPEGRLTKHCKGALTAISDDLEGKVATIMVYQASNTDPNKYQMQYLGHTTIGSGNSYDIRFICSEQPSVESGNYIVTLSVPGSTGLITIDKIEAPKAKHKVRFYYTDGAGKEKQLGEEQIVENGSDAVIPKISDEKLTEEQEREGYTSIGREGYYFVGWSERTTDVTEDREIKAIYVPLKNSIVFVDWLSQSISQEMALTEAVLTAPEGNDENDGHTFIGWKLPDGTNVMAGDEITVTGNMILEAVYETEEYTVRFLDVDGGVVDKQTIRYGESAQPPKYTGEVKGGEFVSWSTETNWWKVTADVDVRPLLSYEGTAETPKIRNVELDVSGSEDITRGVEIASEEEDARIFYTTNGSEPTVEDIQEQMTTGGCTNNLTMAEYSEPITFEEDTMIMAVAYVEGKNLSETAMTYFEIAPETDETNSTAVSDEWEELKTVEVKAAAGKDIEVSVSLEENPGILGCGILVSADDETFYVDTDEYGDPVITPGGVLETGRTESSASKEGWDTTWYGEEQSMRSGKILGMTLHFKEDAEEGMYPISVFYAPDKTYNEEYDEVSLAGAKIEVDSEASVDIEKLEAKLSRTTFNYDGDACEPVVTIEGLNEGEDFEVTYADNVDAGTAKAIMTGKGTYVGIKEMTFTINTVSILQAEIAEIADQAITGSEIRPGLQITFNEKRLEEGKDYDVSYADNIGKGTATVTVTGKGNFKGSATVQFEIVETAESKLAEAEKKLAEAEKAQQEAEAELAAVKAELEKAKSEKEAEALARKEAEAKLEAAKAAQATAEAGAEKAKAAQAEAEARAEKAEAQQEAMQAELDKAKTEKEIAQAQVAAEKAAKEAAQAQAEAAKAAKEVAEADAKVAEKAKEAAQLQEAEAKEKLTQAESDLEAAKKAKAEAESKADEDAKAKEEAERALAKANEAKEAAEADLKEAEKAKETAEARLAEAERAKKEAEVQIAELTKEKEEAERRAEEAEKKLNELLAGGGEEPRPEVKESIEGAVVSGLTTKSYTGKAQRPVPKVKVDGKVLQAERDYTVSYKNNTNVGRATVTISGAGDYTGSISKTFKIVPKSTSITKVTKGKKSFQVSWKKVSSQASGYQIQYAADSKFKKSKKTVTVSSYKTTSKTVTKLSSKKTYYVKVRTYKKVGSTTYYSDWSRYKSVKTK